MVPILVGTAAILSMVGAYVASVPTGIFTQTDYVTGIRIYFEPYNMFMMFVKAFVFGYILASVSCYQGYFVKGGSIELGKASTSAVVYSNILILLADYLIAVVLTA